MNIQQLKEKFKLLGEFRYDLGEIDKGYNNRTLYVNISENTIQKKEVTQFMKDKYLVEFKGIPLWCRKECLAHQ